ncbi:hypothetical protein [Serpentinimonas maccroryi]|uniref:hypothetical protein n=1 Tax=Serpentinimonas maccroryi TaxID=1458426 RepID=UPI00203464FC|nr:hypothetical protein [Serpentinimonas maccroryi]
MFVRIFALAALALLVVGCATPTPPPAAPSPAAAAAAAAAPPGLSTLPFEGGHLLLDTRSPACTITLQGQIHEGTVRRLHTGLQQLQGARCSSRRMLLDASAGELGSAITIGSMLRNRQFDTKVQPGRTCDTPCLLVFAAGTQRVLPLLPQPALLAFTPLPPDQDFAPRTCHSQPHAAQQLTLARYLNAMLPEPSSSNVLRQILAADCNGPARIGAQQALAMGLATSTAAR